MKEAQFGLNKDSRLVDKAGHFNNAKNVVRNEGGDIENEYGFNLVRDFNQTNYICIGAIEFVDLAILFYTDGTTSEIGTFDGSTYVRKFRDQSGSRLNFNKSYPIEGTCERNYKGELIITWTDDYNPPYILNLDNLPFRVDGSKIFNDPNPDKIKLAMLFPDIRLPSITITIGQNTATAGMIYQQTSLSKVNGKSFFIRYRVTNDQYTVWYDVTANIGAYDVKTIPITLTLSGLSSIFDYYQLGVAIHEEGQQYVRIVGEYRTTDNVVNYTGQFIGEATLEEILAVDGTFKQCKTLTSLDNRLIAANLKSGYDINYQKYANNIKVEWGYSVSYIYSATFLPDEVYAFYITFMFKDGTISEAYHIPGRALTYTDRLEVLTSNGFTSDEQALHDKVANRGTLRNFHIKDTSSSSGLSAWENENEYYPDDEDSEIWAGTSGNGYYTGISLAGERVRHHKMPGYIRIYSNGDSPVKVFGVRFTDVFIPDYMRPNVVGFFFSYADRARPGNKTMLGMTYLQPDNVWAGGAPTVTSGVRLHPVNLMVEQASVIVDYLKQYWRADTTISAGFINLNIMDYIVPDVIANTISSLQYRPRANTEVDNDGREACAFIRISPVTFQGDNDHHYMGGMYTFLSDIFSNRSDQPLISFGKLQQVYSGVAVYNTSLIYDGDGIHENNNYLLLRDFGAIIADRVSAEHRNYRTRYAIKFDTDLRDQARLDDENAGQTTAQAYNRNYFVYSELFYVLNNFKPSIPYKTGSRTTEDFPNRIVESNKDTDNVIETAWRRFLVNDYYDTERDKGEIIKIQAVNRVLLIQTAFTTFRASIKDVLKTADITAYLGTGELFDRKPDELMPTPVGKLGNSNQFGVRLCEKGYIFVDKNEQEIFVISSSTKYLNGYINSYLKHIIDQNMIDNPFNGTGICIGYDKKYKRVLFTFKGTSESYTISFSFEDTNNRGDVWISSHDYIPDYYINIKDGLYSIKNFTDHSQIYEHNYLTRKGLYYKALGTGDQDQGSSYIDVVTSPNINMKQMFGTIFWRSTVITLAGSGTETLKEDETIDKIMIYNEHQCSGEIILTDEMKTQFYQGEALKTKYGKYTFSKGVWNFNDFRDEVIHTITSVISGRNILQSVIPFMDIHGNYNNSSIVPFEKPHWDRGRFFGLVIVVRMEYTNDIQRRFILHQVETKATETI